MNSYWSARWSGRVRGRGSAVIAVVLVAVAGFVVDIAPAAATFPGRNGLIAFDVKTITGYGDEATWYFDVYTVRPDGGGLKRLTFNGHSRHPAWGPGGLRILYERPDGIWIMGAAGRHKARVTGPGWWPSWSPDGTRFVFLRENTRWKPGVGANLWELDVYTFATGRTVCLTAGQHPQWSPLGDRIVFADQDPHSFSRGSDGTGLFTIRPDGTGRTEIATARSTTNIDEYLDAPSWAPGGHRIVYSALSIHLTPDGVGRSEETLVIRRANGTEPHAVPNSACFVGPEMWETTVISPDWRWLAGPHHRGPCDSYETNGLALIRPDGTGLHLIMRSGDRTVEIVDWQRLPRT